MFAADRMIKLNAIVMDKFVSGTTMRAPHHQCSDAGMDAFIAKPMEIREVLDVLLPLVR